MSVVENKRLIERWYEALAAGDFETIFDMHHDDVIYNMIGSTPVSGRIYGKDACCNGMIGQKLLEKLIPEKIKFSKQWKIIAAENDQGGWPYAGRWTLPKWRRITSKHIARFLPYVMAKSLSSTPFSIQPWLSNV